MEKVAIELEVEERVNKDSGVVRSSDYGNRGGVGKVVTEVLMSDYHGKYCC